jgi:hypothetical protein
MFFLVLFLASISSISLLCEKLASDLPGLLQLRDGRRRGPAHFAAAGRKFMLFSETLVTYRCQDLLIANALERDAGG